MQLNERHSFHIHVFFLKVPRSGGEPGIFLSFSFIFSHKQRLRPLGYCAPNYPCVFLHLGTIMVTILHRLLVLLLLFEVLALRAIMAAYDLSFGPKLRRHKVTADENNIPPGINVIKNVPTRVIVFV